MVTTKSKDLAPIKTDADHEAALREIDALWGAPVGSPEGNRLEILVVLVEVYECSRWSIFEKDPVEVLESVIASGEHTRAQLAEIIGQSRATEVLKRKRALTLNMIQSISSAWKLPVDVLAQPYQLDQMRQLAAQHEPEALGKTRLTFARNAKSGKFLATSTKGGASARAVELNGNPKPKRRPSGS